MKDVIIKASEDIKLCSWKSKLADELFKLTDKNRKYLQAWLPWVPGVKKLVGCIGLHGLSKDNRRASIGYWLDYNYQGKGIMTLSVKALIDYSFKKLNLNRIGIEIATKNTKSLAIAERLNFVKEGVVREFELVNNQFLSNVIYSLLKREWKN